VRLLGHRDRFEAALRIAPDLLGAQRGIAQVGDAERHDPLRVGRVPLLEEPVVPRAHAGEAELRVLRLGEERASEPGDARREVQRRPDAAEVHVVDAVLDPPAAGPDLVEARGLHPAVFGRAPGHRHEAGLEIRRAFEHPDLVALRALDDARRLLLEAPREPPLEGVRGLHQVIVDGNQRMADLARLGVGEQRARDGALHAELDDLHHGTTSR
jgi:hypothetical protein